MKAEPIRSILHPPSFILVSLPVSPLFIRGWRRMTQAARLRIRIPPFAAPASRSSSRGESALQPRAEARGFRRSFAISSSKQRRWRRWEPSPTSFRFVGENRILAAFGLGGLKASKLVGIRALIESASLTGQTLDSYDVGFRLAPRLNACGRMGHGARRSRC